MTNQFSPELLQAFYARLAGMPAQAPQPSLPTQAHPTRFFPGYNGGSDRTMAGAFHAMRNQRSAVDPMYGTEPESMSEVRGDVLASPARQEDFEDYAPAAPKKKATAAESRRVERAVEDHPRMAAKGEREGEALRMALDQNAADRDAYAAQRNAGPPRGLGGTRVSDAQAGQLAQWAGQMQAQQQAMYGSPPAVGPMAAAPPPPPPMAPPPAPPPGPPMPYRAATQDKVDEDPYAYREPMPFRYGGM